LGAFLFPGDDVFKKIRVLSGGEKNRVAMVKVLLLNANVLILDEPTNHLDIQSKEILLQALRQYPGTILFVSHDRSFLDSLANRIFELTPHKIISYKGNYESYLYQKHHQEVRESGEDSQAHTHSHARTGLSVPQKTVTRTPDTNTQDSKQDKKQEEKDRYELRKKITNLERKIERCEQERDSLYKQYDQGDTQNDGFVSLNKKVQEVQQELEKLYDSWEALQRAPNKNI
jgi:ATP-binding cassette subfamily F protein 3